MVTRTFTSTKVKAMVIDNETASVETIEKDLPKEYDSHDAILRTLNKKYPIDGKKYVHVLSTEKVQTRRGQTDEYFLEHSVELPPLKKGEAEQEND